MIIIVFWCRLDKYNIYLSKFRQKQEDIVNKAMFEGLDPTVDYVRTNFNGVRGDGFLFGLTF